jgi:hypothetical protein
MRGSVCPSKERLPGVPPGPRISYDSMVSLLAPYGSQSALAVAMDLDVKVESLLKTAAS